ncbi:pyridoxamine 5'-phosphate oxidase family protein [Candidatus Saccharibacteria bacterium]|nr:pyridoxamine 5'-phosphate oxidase family protein [Candidatus Saccharibacteria bacterium]
MDDETAAEQFLDNCQFMTIAVAENGEPWAVPVHIARREGMVFEWDSSTEAVHSRAIEAHPRVALSMFRLTFGEVKEFGFYAQATAKKLTEIGNGRARYQAVVDRAWINDERHVKRKIDVVGSKQA